MQYIRFSHAYPKLHGQKKAELLAVRVLNHDLLNPELVEYDTKFTQPIHVKNEFGYPADHCTLPKYGPLLQLIFVGNLQIPFCTLRLHNYEKEKYYRGLIGTEFKIVFNGGI